MTPSPLHAAGGLLAGLSYPFRALALINRRRELWGYILVPILVNVVVAMVLYLGLFAGSWYALDSAIGPSGSELVTVVLVVLRVVLGLTLAVVIGFLMVRFGVVLGAPWYGRLSEHLEATLTGRAEQEVRLTVSAVLHDIWRALLFELKKLLLVLAIWLPSLLLLLIPVAGAMLYAIVGFLLGALISCLDFFDGPQERRRLGFRAKLNTVRTYFPASLSFGALAFILVSIPVVNLLSIPLCVTAGTMFLIDRESQRT